jgi:hypothetical protein
VSRYVARIESRRPQADAFAYLAQFDNIRDWDPSVVSARAEAGGPPGLGSRFEVVVRFAGRSQPYRYEVVRFEPGRLVALEARTSSVRSFDTVTVEPAATGSTVTYDAQLELLGAWRVLSPLVALLFRRLGDAAAAGLRRELNR